MITTMIFPVRPESFSGSRQLIGRGFAAIRGYQASFCLYPMAERRPASASIVRVIPRSAA